MTTILLNNPQFIEIQNLAERLPMNIQSARAKLAPLVSKNPEATEKVFEEFDRFADRLSLFCSAGLLASSEVSQILEALLYAADRHQSQTRKGQEALPYIIHPIGVARQILEIGGISDPKILMAALLHDVVEDTFEAEDPEAGFREISKRFGSAVEIYVREVTDNRTLTRAERKQMQIEHAAHKSPGASAIKLSDKLYNLKDLLHAIPPDWEEGRAEAYFAWAEKVAEKLPTPTENLLALKQALYEVLEQHNQ